MPNTLYDKIWKEHLVDQQDDGTALLFVDRHLVHEVTSPQAFEGLRNSKRKVRHPKLTLAVADHNVPTTDRTNGISDKESKIQVDTLEKNCKEFDIQLFGMEDKRQGIVHIIGPEQGFTQPGTVIVCGDSHTATHGAFGALAFGIGTSEVEHVLATQTLVQKKAKNFRINVNGKLPLGVTSKDVILQIIGKIGTAGGTGCVIEYAGDLIRSLSVEQRMTICNMLHIVILCSTLNDLIKSPAYSITHPVPPAVPIFPIICKITSFEVTPNGSFPLTLILKFFAFFCTKVCVASTCSTSEVPIPNAKAPNAPCVAV